MEVVETSEESRKAAEEASKNIIDTMRRDAALIPTILRQFLDYLSTYGMVYQPNYLFEFENIKNDTTYTLSR